jgi:hypothetical protein
VKPLGPRPVVVAGSRSPVARCACGGRYQVIDEGSGYTLVHSIPACERFDRIASPDEFVTYSEENRRLNVS